MEADGEINGQVATSRNGKPKRVHRPHRVEVTFNDEEKAKFDEMYALSDGETITDFFREILFKQKKYYLANKEFTAAQKALAYELKAIGNNLNQIALFLNKYKFQGRRDWLVELRAIRHWVEQTERGNR